ncbi:sigma-70 family RNA polymerase sigma factor [Rhodoplanes sp. TEM]|uniref:Sigma-70 family RNA polymerase sigma factor n=1 Tax=Rhodoplanes tepidamans TaxID=200616 RepID=A0ABT5JCB9_RHOTP|nr:MULTISPECIES: sigma-70 family RNA polymerase sigma factor [Rhodoplanes]MDC7787011.1 sigma-70 family RNA polymerase sigma factor [Rhodoplanes tepidamans]MDC7987019.1 sigma-70 family RNA polymerase sigma factor [Rhodoplanes sp. TEM]MDQ0354264.1 RNA polymerase sigma-70 factor (ECF subfamily) [Rhodoplanes tepidamans]
MSETRPATLRETIVSRYEHVRARLARLLGRDLAEDVLQETWLRLEQGETAGAIRQPESYIFRVALNLATDRRRAERRLATRAEVLATIGRADPPDLAREMEARLEVEALKKAMAELSPRRRAILIAARVDGLSHDTIASRLGISRTMVQKELRRAVQHCAARLGQSPDDQKSSEDR